MATLNLSTNGPSISKTYQSIIDAPLPAAASSTHGQWALYSVSAPLANAFKPESASSESVLKVETIGAGELTDLVEEFSDGRIQFGFVKVKDPNTTLAKYVLIGWCGEGVPERTKGYFTSHLAAASKVLRGYHVQITARSDRDLTAEGIIQKVADSSGSKYSAAAPSTSTGPPPPLASKPVFNPTRTGGGGSSFNPLAASRSQPAQPQGGNVDGDGWGDDAPPVTRTQLEKVQSAYQPTKVNMSELTKQREEPSRFASRDARDENPDVVKGAYQPVGKVDIAAIRRQAQTSGGTRDERPTTVKGAYEPVGKVDIAAIRARAQPPSGGGGTGMASGLSPAATGTSAVSQDSTERPASLADRSSAFTQSERLTSLPKPKVGNKFGSSASTFTGTKPPAPTGFGLDSKPAQAPPVGTASRTFADEGGKTPAQIWAEKKARERGTSVTSDNAPGIGAAPIASQSSGGEEWKSGYSGKSWAPVPTGRTGGSGGIEQQRTGDEPREEEDDLTSAGGVSAIRDRFKGAAPMGAAAVPSSFTGDRSNPSPPPLATASKPNAGPGARAIPGIAPAPAFQEEDDYRMPTPPAVPRSPTPPTPPSMRPSSPIRVAMPVGRGHGEAPMSPPEERFSPPPVPTEAISAAVPHARDLTDEPVGHDPARGAGMAAAAASFPSSTPSGGAGHGPRALVQYEYEKAEDNEINLVEGQYVHNIDMVDDDWWMVTNEKGESGLVPANYLELVHEEEEAPAHSEPAQTHTPAAPAAAATPAASKAGSTATAIYDYEAAEDNELSFPEGATITDIEFPDEDWWMGSYKGKQALFPGSYVELHK